MRLKNIKKFVFNSSLDLNERLFVLMMSVMLISWVLALAELIFVSGTVMDILVLAGGIVLFAAVSVLSIKLDRIKLGAMILSAGVVFIYVPMTFFYGGGINGDAPIWFVFAVFFVNMSLSGKTKVLYICFSFVTAAVCWSVSYFYPDTIVPNTPIMAHIFSYIALVLIGLSISVTVGFHTHIYKQEVKRSEEQKKEIEALNRSQSSFFSSMSHEIRTPINTIIGLNEMILREDISDEVAEDAANIQSASKMLLHLINDILDMSKLASGHMQLNPTPYHPGDMLSEIVGMLWLRAKEKKLEFRVNVEPDVPYELSGDEVRIKQILINVLNNAIKYTKEGSVTLTIQCGSRTDTSVDIIYSVTDTGMGIKKESIPYLFTAFKRVDEEKNRHIEGTGLGLSIVKELVDLMGGRITVNSIYTKGTTFVIEIPQKIVNDRRIGDVDIASRHKLNIRAGYKQKFEAPDAKVLVVDDNASNLLVVSKLLRGTKVKTETAASGAEALKRTLRTEYNVIFMDHLMPEMDGVECFRRIRTQVGGKCRETKIVALTANAGAENREIYENEGFDGYLVKPVSGDELEKELYRLLPNELIRVTDNSDDILEESISWMQNSRKKKTVAVTTESVADLPQELTDKYDIGIIPHMVCTENGKFRDGTEIETRGLLNYMKDVSRKVVTKAPDVGEHEMFFAKQLENAYNVIHISITGTVANSGYLPASEAAAAFDNVTVIDSGHLSSGQGLLALEAGRMAEEGKSSEEITRRISELSSRTRTSFIVEELDFLARAGQVSPRIADFTKSLMARPVLVLKKGRMGVGKVFFGTRERSWKRYIDTVLSSPAKIDRRILFVTYVGLTAKEMDWIRTRIESRMTFDNIYFQEASPAIAVNCGPGTFGLLFMETAEKDV